MALTKMDIGTELGKGWKLFQPNMGLLIVAGLIATLVSAVTCGLLAGPLSAGFFLIVRRLIQNDPVKPQPGDVFKGFDFFVQALVLYVLCLLVTILLCLIPVVGHVASLLVGSVMMWGILFVVYQGLTAMDALKKLFGLLQSGEFTVPFIYGVIVTLISGLGALACIVGIFFTIPLAYCMMACCYETLFGGAPEVIEPEVVPPPPSDMRL